MDVKNINVKTAVVGSVVFGLIFGALTYTVLRFISPEDAFLLAVLSGLICYLGMFISLLLYSRWEKKKYAKIEKDLSSPAFLKTEGSIRAGRKMLACRIYFCETCVAVASIEVKPYILEEFKWQDLCRIEGDKIRLIFVTNDQKTLCFTVVNAEDVINELKRRGFII